MLACLPRSGARLCASRAISTSARPSSLYTNIDKGLEPAINTTPYDLTTTQREALDSALRVDQAGEIAANWIYKGQMAILGRDPIIGSLIQDMWDQEKKHLLVMDKLQTQHNVRPTILSDAAKVAGFGLGALTAFIGKEAAMACTEAVETVIGEHYDDQLKELDSFSSTHPSLALLKGIIREFRDDELEHLDTAIANFSQRAPAHALLSSLVGAGCKVAIEVCKRV
ncbi:COQ7 protein [Crassisporium funariophilum]|nr:COQ7 protein [Crassisporium funariophilum]